MQGERGRYQSGKVSARFTSFSQPRQYRLNARGIDLARNRIKAQRRLAAIMCADVSGYSRLMNSDQARTLHLLASHREIIDRLIAENGGRIANTAGDSVLAEFSSAADAVHCALLVQEKIAAVNETMPEGRRMRFRIGIHVGEVLVRGRDILGDDVNIAARLQGVAAPGTICLSGAARSFVRDSIALPFEDIGPQEVKNIAAPVSAFLLRPASRPGQRVIPLVHRRVEVNLIRRCYERMSVAVAAVTKPHGLEPIESALIGSLRDAPGITHIELAERAGLDPGRCLKLTRHLEKLGLVKGAAKAKHRRARPLMLTAAGQRTYRRIAPPLLASQDRIMAPLSEAERETLRDLLARVVLANEAKSSQS